MKIIPALLAAALAATTLAATELPTGQLMSVTKIREGLKSRHAGSYDRSGGNGDNVSNIADGETRTLFDVKGAGIIERFWVTIAPPPEGLSRNDVILRMYWDGNPEPSVNSPIGPFFGQGWDESYPFVSAPLADAPREGRAMVCYFAMPFANGARIEIENQSGKRIDAFYYNIDYVTMDALPADEGRFHAWYHREITPAAPDGENEWSVLGPQGRNPDGARNYVIADIQGHGQFVGVNYYVQSPSPMWYGEGDEMAFIDGETTPSIIGTGTEDYFNQSWSPTQLYSHPYFGTARVGGETGWLGRYHNYRFHLADPIYFDKSLKFTIEHGHNNVLTLDLATVAYWYQAKATGVPAIPDKAGRKLMPAIGAVEILRWRDAWRREMGNGPELWGNEKKAEKTKP
ncbi:MAG TPA: glycoside hydrolase family 172 protein [Opitutus sp.]|nr:glycoside hydrolase family 172 protein [Opitutus sp.]